MAYYSGQGRFAVAERDAVTGKAKAFTYLGNVTSCNLSIEIDKFEHKESQTGQRAVDLTVIREKKAAFQMVLEDFALDNLVIALYGTKATVSGASVTNELLKGVKKGQPSAVRFPKSISAVTVSGVGGTPTHTVTTDYTIDTNYGLIIPTVGGAIADDSDIEVDYTYGAHTRLDAFTQTSMERWLRFEGLNTVDGSRVILNLFKAQIDPLQGYELINDEVGSLQLNGSVLYDPLATGGSNFFEEIRL